MSKIRMHYKRNYTVISNDCVRDKNLTLKAKGLMLVLWSLPDEWNFSVDGLASFMKEGKSAITSAIRELEECGYLTRSQKRLPNGRADGYDWILTDNPSNSAPSAENQMTGNQALLNKEELSTEGESKEENLKKNKEKGEQYENLELVPTELTPSCTEQIRANTITDIIEYLNQMANTRFNPTARVHREHINARLDEGFTTEDFKMVIAFKCLQWYGTGMQKYLRPQTLFSNKFDNYLQEALAEKTKTTGKGESVGLMFLKFCRAMAWTNNEYILNEDNSVRNVTRNYDINFDEWMNIAKRESQ